MITSATRRLPLLFLLLILGCSGKVPTSSSTAQTITPVTFAAAALPTPILGQAYAVALHANGGISPYLFSVASGTMPPGLTLSSAGALAGTPTTAGTFQFQIAVSDQSTPPGTAAHVFSVIAAPLLSLAGSLPVATVRAPYTVALATGGLPPYSVTLTSGTLPTGLTLSPSGTLAGTPTTAGIFSLLLNATDTSNQTATLAATLVVNSPTLTLPAIAPLSLTRNHAFSQTFSANGGIPPYTFSLASGTLPPGLTLSSSGILAGTPAAGGLFPTNLQVADSSNPAQTATTPLSLSVLTATASVDPTTPIAIVPDTALGIHTAVYDPSLSDTTQLPALLADDGIRFLRYPGGSYADRYHWAQNTLTPIFATPRPACFNDTLGYLAPNTDFGSFVRTLDATGTQAIITVNYGTSVADSHATRSPSNHTTAGCSEPNTAGQPEEAAAWVAYANGNPSDPHTIGYDAAGFNWQTTGFWASLRASAPLATDDGYNFLRLNRPTPIGVHFWEVGNEIYYDGWNNNINTETDLHAPYIYPSGYGSAFTSRLGLPAIAPAVYGATAATYVAAMRAVDPTIKVGIVVGDTIDPISHSWTPAVLQALCAASTFDFAILHYYPGTFNVVTAAQLLSLPQTDMPSLTAGLHSAIANACPTIASTPIFLTETNPNGTLVPNTPAAIPGLFAAQEILSALESGIQNVDWLELHGGAGTFLTELTEAPGPAFFGVQLAHVVATPGNTLLSTTSSSATLLLHAARTASGGYAVLLLNADPANTATVQLTLPGALANTTATQYTYGLSTNPTTPTLPGTAFPIPGPTFTLQIPPYTATVLTTP